MSFQALQVSKRGDAVHAAVVRMQASELMPGDVEVRVDYSTLNYKDALAVTGAAPIVQVFPLVAGIDLAGTVEQSSHPDFAPGDAVLVNGWVLSQTHHGGYAQRARVRGDWLVRRPPAFDA
ncbi:alcohol dehydrogenase catalytic domain-containing protein, partial [Xanthomonas sp. Kuri4-1]